MIDEIKRMNIKKVEEYYLVTGSNYKPLIIDNKNFHDIAYSSKNDDITFIDGGNAVLFEGSGFALGFIRTAAITYRNNKRISRDISDFYILISEQDKKFIVKTFPENIFNGLELIEKDLEKCSAVVSVVRRLAELNHASKFQNPILDGTLESRYAYELEYIRKIKNPVALSKTCSLTTNSGSGITDHLYSLNNGKWAYYPIVENYPAEMIFVKLNENSDYVFRLDASKHVDYNNIIYLLAKNSIDPVFLGYPYGLVDADATARISEEEKKMLQTTISVKLGKHWSSFSKYLKSMNAHEILDNIKF